MSDNILYIDNKVIDVNDFNVFELDVDNNTIALTCTRIDPIFRVILFVKSKTEGEQLLQNIYNIKSSQQKTKEPLPYSIPANVTTTADDLKDEACEWINGDNCETQKEQDV